MNEQKERISSLENVAEAKPQSDDADIKIIKNAPEIQKLHRNRRQVDSTKNASEDKSTSEVMLKIDKLLSSGRLHLCQSTGVTCSSGPPRPPGPPGPRGHKGARGRKGRNGNKGDKGIMGSPGKSGKQGIMGPGGLKGETGTKVHPRVSLHPGPFHVIEGSNITLPTCHVTGYPAPVVTWRKLSGQLPQGRAQYNNTALQISDVRKVDSDAYFCSAVNLLGNVERKTLLVVISLPKFTVKPPGKVFASTGDTLTFNCSATGDPRPVISWKRQGAALPVGRSHRTNDALVIRDLKEEDAGNYICVATSAGVFDIETISYVDVRILKDCSELLKSGQTQRGVYSVNPDGRGHFNVYCDMHTDGGGWTVFQRRQDGSVDFYRGWNDYKAGFGQLTGEFWLGNDKIHRLTASRPSTLRVELEDWSGGKAYAKYGKFNIGDEQAQYRLAVGSYSGTAGDSLTRHNNKAFTTKDRDNDPHSSVNCAVYYNGAWWYDRCHDSNLNGKYLKQKNDDRGARWSRFRGSLSLKFTEMKLRPSS